VINGLTDYAHTTQVVCDMFTMVEHKLPDKKMEDLTMTFVGSGTGSVMSSFITGPMTRAILDSQCWPHPTQN
jgi:putrescine carbamoyltransferase